MFQSGAFVDVPLPALQLQKGPNETKKYGRQRNNLSKPLFRRYGVSLRNKPTELRFRNTARGGSAGPSFPRILHGTVQREPVWYGATMCQQSVSVQAESASVRVAFLEQLASELSNNLHSAMNRSSELQAEVNRKTELLQQYAWEIDQLRQHSTCGEQRVTCPEAAPESISRSDANPVLKVCSCCGAANKRAYEKTHRTHPQRFTWPLPLSMSPKQVAQSQQCATRGWVACFRARQINIPVP